MNIIQFLLSIQPSELVLVLFIATLFDIWTGVRLSLKQKTTVSRRFITSILPNMAMVFTPFVLTMSPALVTSVVAKIVVLVFSLLYVVGTIGSAMANYAVLFPKEHNWITKFAYRYLSQELKAKRLKHLIDDGKDSELSQDEETPKG